MSLEELKKDAAEFDHLLCVATHRSVKGAIAAAKAHVDKQIIDLEEKARKEAQLDAAAAGPAPKRYLVELTEYAWDQSEKYVKLYITLNGVQKLDESCVVAKFTTNTMHLLLINTDGKDYELKANNLLAPIDADNSFRKVKNDMVVVYLKKQQEGKNWETLNTIEKRFKDIKDRAIKAICNTQCSDSVFMAALTTLYNNSDAQVKKKFSEAWKDSGNTALIVINGDRDDIK